MPRRSVGGQRTMPVAEFHAIFGQALLNLSDVRAVASFHGAEHMDARWVRPGKGPIVNNLGDVAARGSEHGGQMREAALIGASKR